jgi:hypothetical protein
MGKSAIADISQVVMRRLTEDSKRDRRHRNPVDASMIRQSTSPCAANRRFLSAECGWGPPLKPLNCLSPVGYERRALSCTKRMHRYVENASKAAEKWKLITRASTASPHSALARKAERNGLCRLLERTGYEVRSAVDGVEALQQIRDDKFDLLLVDIWMRE